MADRVKVACINWDHPSPVPHAMVYVLRRGVMIADWYFETWRQAMTFALSLPKMKVMK